MGSFMGGSAPAMAQQIADGNTLVSPVILKRLTVQQMETLLFELEKRMRESRAQQPSLDDQAALQARNRRISRIMGGVRVIKYQLQQRRRKGV